MSREVLQQTYTLSEANVKDLIGWLRAGQINRALIALEHLNPAEPAQPVQTEQEPVAWMCQEYRAAFMGDLQWFDEVEFVQPPNDPERFRNITPLYASPPQPTIKQSLTVEPVAWWDAKLGVFDEKQFDQLQPLYRAPPQREWVGLTDDEIKAIVGPWGSTEIKGYTRKLFDQIEAALKEKNT